MEKKEDISNTFGNEIFVKAYYYHANGLTFVVSPLYLYEILEFENDKMPNCSGYDETPTDGELLLWWISVFYRKKTDIEKTEKEEKKGFFQKIKDYVNNKQEEKTHRKEYDSFVIGGKIVAWMEKKIKINGKNIVFHDLENKYRLSKAEIARLYFYWLEISGFPNPLGNGINEILQRKIIEN